MTLSPIQEFDIWFKEAQKTSLRYPNAMSLATVSAAGIPAVRVVLMKHFDELGLVFYTNLESNKSKDIQATHVVATVFHWEELGKQVRVSGRVESVTDAEADAYFASRARDSQIGAWASKQSQPMANRAEFEERLVTYTQQFEGKPVPRPEGWSGWRVSADRVEFWQERPFRLHDRWVYTRNGSEWARQLLYP